MSFLFNTIIKMAGIMNMSLHFTHNTLTNTPAKEDPIEAKKYCMKPSKSRVKIAIK